MLSAKASIGVETSKLMLVHLDFADMGLANWEARLQNPKVFVSVKNYGRTPAFVDSQAVEIHWGPTLPDEPDYSLNSENVPPETVIEAKEIHKLAETRSRTLLSLPEIESIKEGTTRVWVYGFVNYRDFLGDRHITRFCKQLIAFRGLSTGRYSWIEWNENPTYTHSY